MRCWEMAVIFLQGTWGIVQNLAGGVIFLLHIRERYFYYKGSVVTFWDMPEMSLGIGMFIFLSKDYVTVNKPVLKIAKSNKRI